MATATIYTLLAATGMYLHCRDDLTEKEKNIAQFLILYGGLTVMLLLWLESSGWASSFSWLP